MRAKARRRDLQPQATAVLPKTLPVVWRRAGIGVALIVITLFAFSNSFTAGFALDNKGLLNDPRIVEPTGHNLGLILHHTYWWPNGESGLYRPFTTLSYLFNFAILGNGDEPAGYHWLNFILHGCNVLLVYFLLQRFTGKLEVAAFAAAAWAVHPVLTESVTNIVGRSDLLAGGATIGGLLMYLTSSETTGWRRTAWLMGLMGITLVGVLSKESAVCIVGLMLLYELAWGRTRARIPALLLGCGAAAVPIAVMLYQRSKVLAASLPAEFPFTDNPIVGAGFWIGRRTALKVIARYLWLSVWPAKLSCDYSYSEIALARGTLGDWAAWIVVLAAIVLIGCAYRWNRAAFFWAGFAAITFFPMSNLAFPIGTIMAERFLYLPAIGLVACAVLAIFGVGERLRIPWLPRVAMCLVIAGFAIRTWERNADWRDERSIITAGLEVSPSSYKLHKQMAALLFGNERTPENIRRGKAEAERSVALLDSLPDIHSTAEPFCLAGGYDFMEAELQSAAFGNSAGLSPAGIAAYEKGIALIERCAAIDKTVHATYLAKLQRGMLAPEGDPQPYLMLSGAFLRLNELDKAVAAVREALRLYPRSPAGYLQVANVFMRENLREDAANALTEGLLLTSGSGLAQPFAALSRGAPDSGHCDVIQTPAGETIDPQCAPFRQRVCMLAADVLKVRTRMGRSDLAEKDRIEFEEKYGCPPLP